MFHNRVGMMLYLSCEFIETDLGYRVLFLFFKKNLIQILVKEKENISLTLSLKDI